MLRINELPLAGRVDRRSFYFRDRAPRGTRTYSLPHRLVQKFEENFAKHKAVALAAENVCFAVPSERDRLLEMIRGLETSAAGRARESDARPSPSPPSPTSPSVNTYSRACRNLGERWSTPCPFLPKTNGLPVEVKRQQIIHFQGEETTNNLFTGESENN